MKVRILGCGASGGTPLASGFWGNCNPSNPKNRRRRSSILIEDQDVTILVDASPDLREQWLEASPERLSAILLTHGHFDHVAGLEELRPIVVFQNNRQPLTAYGDLKTCEELRQRCPYLLTSPPSPAAAEASPEAPQKDLYPPLVHLVDHGYESFSVGHLEISPFLQDHGFSESVGYRIGGFAYSTDVVSFPEASRPFLKDLDVWIVDCMGPHPRPTHAHLELTLSWIEEFKPKRAYLIHMDVSADYDDMQRQLPEGVTVCWDGLEIDMPSMSQKY